MNGISKSLKKDKWDESYSRGENYIFETKEQLVKFLNRHVRKKIGPESFKDIIDFSRGVRALDFGCGIGRQTMLLEEYGMEAYGMDLSDKAVAMAKELAKKRNMPSLQNRFMTSSSGVLPFDENFFQVIVCDSVLDSMPFALAQDFVKEFDRVLNGLGYISLISGDCSDYHREFDEEVEVSGKHEQGTIQSYFNWRKVNELFEGTKLKIFYASLAQEHDLLGRGKKGRFHIGFRNA
jgi:ubiquinone/menaquinone biosynthesis C-methylase UbiE